MFVKLNIQKYCVRICVIMRNKFDLRTILQTHSCCGKPAAE
ncbi:hypothetical protein HMPREF1579_00717 [Gardnerella vaginalis JCP8066]|nr:hypothetical protein HMPREF1579_00717 [Gardnerella vaginalis JCP8066]